MASGGEPTVRRYSLPWPHANLNPNARVHWSTRARLRKNQRALWAWSARSQGARALAADRLAVRLQFHPPDRRARDLDNCLASCKAGIDGLADVLGIDDSRWQLAIEMGEPGFIGHVVVEVTPC